MERVTFCNASGTKLVGHYRGAGHANGVVMAHGFCNDKSSNGRFERLGNALLDENIASLAFDFAGCGESGDALLTPEGLSQDMEAAIAWMGARGHHKLGLFGNSLGGSVVLQVRSDAVCALAVTGAATAPTTYNWSEHFSASQLESLGSRGFLVEADDGRWRSEIRIASGLLDFFDAVEQTDRLEGLQAPVLLIYGEDPDDTEEQALLAAARHGFSLFPEGSSLQLIPGARHGMRDQWASVCGLVTSWFGNHLKIAKP
jgi:pimeloyl-ACP methyl ester carboxylesterase